VFSRGVAAYQRGDWQQAEVDFSEYLAQTPPATARRDAYFYLAEVRVQLGRYTLAHQGYRDYLAQGQDDPPAMIRRARFRLGETSYLSGDYGSAIQELEQFIARHPADALASRAGEYLAEIARDEDRVDQARFWYESVLKETTDDRQATRCRAALTRLERTAPASSQTDPGPQLTAATSHPLDAARSAANCGQHEQAIRLVQQILDAPSDFDDEIRRQAAELGFREWLALGDDRAALQTFSGYLWDAGISTQAELDLRREAVSILDANGYHRAAARELARCQLIEHATSPPTDWPRLLRSLPREPG
jgi:tetratricopeptide (TPR) repeat protein